MFAYQQEQDNRFMWLLQRATKTSRGSSSLANATIGRRAFYSTDEDSNEQQKSRESIVRVHQLSSIACVAFFNGATTTTHSSTCRGQQQTPPDLHAWKSKEKDILDRVNASMVDDSVRPSALQPWVRLTFGLAGFLSPPSVRRSILGGMYDGMLDMYTDQLRELHENESKMDDVKSMIKTLRDEREDLLPDNTSPSALVLASLIMTNNNKDGQNNDDASETEMIVASAAKQMTTMFLSMAKRI